jgi:Sulfotransferase domain
MAANRSLVSRSARSVGKASIRRWGILTSDRRTLPDFLIIGTKRGGTTSMYNVVAGHPNVLPLFPAAQGLKGVHFFDQHYDRGMAWYRSHFPTAGQRERARSHVGGRAIAGEGSPYSLFHPLAAERVARDLPDVKLIVQLRDPVDRAYSHYKERVRHDAEPLSFEEAIQAEPERLRGEQERIISQAPHYHSFAHENWSYAAHGVYAPQLERWMGLIPRERFLILRSEDIYEDFAREYAKVVAFLGLPAWTPPDFPMLNYHPSADMDTDVRTRLQEYFAAPNARLAELLGRDFHWSS